MNKAIWIYGGLLTLAACTSAPDVGDDELNTYGLTDTGAGGSATQGGNGGAVTGGGGASSSGGTTGTGGTTDGGGTTGGGTTGTGGTTDGGGTTGGGTTGGGTTGGGTTGTGGTAGSGGSAGHGGDSDSGVDIDVDRNRNDILENDKDDPDEDAPFKFMDNAGALVLVNCDSDIGNHERDMDDFISNGADDKLDMSPLSLELKQDLKNGEELWLVLKGDDTDGKIWLNVIDPLGGDDQVLVGPKPHVFQIRLNDLKYDNGEVLFPGGKKKRYDGRFLLEGLNFNKTSTLTLEIRGGTSGASDVVRVRNTPWLANNNTQPLAPKPRWIIPGNLINSTSYGFKDGMHGADLVKAGEILEFVQDSAEWGFQVRRNSANPAAARTMITALRLYTENEDKHPVTMFLSAKTGVYGYQDKPNTVPFEPFQDENYFNKEDGDQGGNLECLPPSDAYPFGRIIHGDTMSQKLRDFLARQEVQVTPGGAVILEISKIHLRHIDEVLAVAPKDGGYLVVMPDWKLAKDLMKTAKGTHHNVPVFFFMEVKGKKDPDKKSMETYGEILNYLDKHKDGKIVDDLFQTTLAAFQKQVQAAGATVLPLPGMYLLSDGGGVGDVQRSFPRNIANSQPTLPGRLIVSRPPLQGEDRRHEESIFLKEWIKVLGVQKIKAEPEEMNFAWRKGGEVHCSSNVLREPIAK